MESRRSAKSKFKDKLGQMSGIVSLRGDTWKDEFWISVAKALFLPRRVFTVYTSIGRFLYSDVVARTNYGMFFCRKGTVDLGFISDSFEYGVTNVMNSIEGNFVDCGAYIGKYTIMASKLGSVDNVVSIEPDPDNRSVLERNIALNGCKNVKVLGKAIWKTRGKIDFNKARSETTSFVGIDDSHYEREVFDTISVGTMKLEDVAKVVAKVDWIKMDIEGAEYEVLMSSERFLRKHRPNIILELHEKILGGKRSRELLTHMKKLGYQVEHINFGYYLLVWKENSDKTY